MKLLLPFVACLALGSAAAEDITLTAENTANQVAYSQAVTLGEGESAELVFAHGDDNARIEYIKGSKTYEIYCKRNMAQIGSTVVTETNPVVLAGPASFRMKVGSTSSAGIYSGFATFSIKRIGITSSTTAIPQEPGSNWEVALESSSDLVNWIAVNPGDYTGTEVNRFFRMRLVRKETP